MGGFYQLNQTQHIIILCATQPLQLMERELGKGSTSPKTKVLIQKHLMRTVEL